MLWALVISADSYLYNHRNSNAISSSRQPEVNGRRLPRGDTKIQPLRVVASSSELINRAATKAITKLISTCGIGAYAGKVGILDQSALSVLSKLIFNVFQPCLLFVNVASTITRQCSGATNSNMASIFLLPFAAILQIFVGYIVGKVVSLFMYKDNPSDEGAKQLLACTTFANSGPLPLVFTDGLFHSHPDHSLLGRSAAYISLYLLGWSPLFWIIGPAILKENNGSAENVDKVKARKELLQRIFSPPVVGSMVGMMVGFTPILRNLIVSTHGMLNPIFEAMRTLGAAYLPAVLLVLSGSLSPPPTAASSSPSSTPNTALDSKFMLKVVSIYLARFLLMPTIGFGLYKLGVQYIPGARELFKKDPLLLLVLLLETCMPSAQNTTVILQLQGNKAAATRLARTLMVVYILGVPAMSYWLIKILTLTKLAS